MKIGFFGTPEIAASTLQYCIEAQDIEVVYVVSQPDRPVGRHATITPSPVAQLARAHNIPLYQPERIRSNTEFISALQAYDVDFLVVIAYGNILPVEILELPRLLPVNIHGSILPKYRGASPIQSVLLFGEKQTGITIMEMTKGMDEGRILRIFPIDIATDETSDSLFEKFCKCSGEALGETLRAYIHSEITVVEQNHLEATYTKKFEKEDGQFFWEKFSAKELYRRWQAVTSWPGAWSTLGGKRCKIISCSLPLFSPDEILSLQGNHFAGDILKIEGKVYVVTKEGMLELGEVILEGKPKRPAIQALEGYTKFDS